MQNRLFNLGEKMAKKQSDTSEGTKVRRIKATDDKPIAKPITKKKDTATSKPQKKVTATPKEEAPTKNPFKAFSRYLKGAWYELKQVRWPNRTATWSLTLAVLVFTVFFVVLVILLDTGFNWLFEQILK